MVLLSASSDEAPLAVPDVFDFDSLIFVPASPMPWTDVLKPQSLLSACRRPTFSRPRSRVRQNKKNAEIIFGASALDAPSSEHGKQAVNNGARRPV